MRKAGGGDTFYICNRSTIECSDNKLGGNIVASGDKSEKAVQLSNTGTISFDGETLISLSGASCHLQSTKQKTHLPCADADDVLMH